MIWVGHVCHPERLALCHHQRVGRRKEVLIEMPSPPATFRILVCFAMQPLG